MPLSYLIAKANIPVLQVSLPYDLSAEGAVLLGNALAPLRERGVMIMGSGSLTHNLYEIGSTAAGIFSSTCTQGRGSALRFTIFWCFSPS